MFDYKVFKSEYSIRPLLLAVYCASYLCYGLEAQSSWWWLSIDFRGCSLFGDDALGSDLLLLLMRLGLACNAFNICAWGGRWDLWDFVAGSS